MGDIKNYVIGYQIKSKKIPDNLMKKGLTKLEMKSIKPKEKNQWKLKEGEEVIEKEEEIANIFNNFFIEKISLLKDGVDLKYVKEPLA
jgi:hypothetical protein